MRIGLVGNPNVGKSTIFNNLTGMHQHTGNWPGKTVDSKAGIKKYNGVEYLIEDLPGTYSLMAHSKEEEVTRDFIYKEKYDALIIVCDAVCLERNLNLVLQVLEITNKVLICVNLMDEAKKKKIDVDIKELSNILNVPVIGVCAKTKKNNNEIMSALEKVCLKEEGFLPIKYDEYLTTSINMLIKYAKEEGNKELYALNLLTSNKNIKEIKDALNYLYEKGIKKEDIETLKLESIMNRANFITKNTVTFNKKDYNKRDVIIDKIVTHKILSIPFMLMLLLVVFWITIVIANYPSNFLYNLFFSIEDNLFNILPFNNSINDLLVYGVYRVLAWVVSVMLPPMVIFFALFSLLEDLGYLPRIAFCLDKTFKKCASCGKQALTMVMGFGCNAVGVVGGRIIDSPRERLMAILTNCFVPCNGRFPLLISLIAMFLVVGNSFLKSFILTIFILIGIIMTFIVTKILSKTLLKGIPSSFTLELPPYRKPQIIKVIIRSVFDRSIFVLKRAIIASLPAGVIIWSMANININNSSILQICANSLDPFAHLLGMDGVILLAFILAFPANEIVIPIIIMGYMSLGHLTEINDLSVLRELFINNGWTMITAICTMLFSLIHFPCLTTVLTIKKETNSLKWTILSIVIPTISGIVLCFLVNSIYHLFI